MSDPSNASQVAPLRLIVMGTGPFAVPSFEALRLAGHEISLVVTKPQPTVKSRRGPPPAPVRSWAEQHALTIFDPLSINEEIAVNRIVESEADLLIVCDYGQILKPPALAAAKLGGINLHGSLLPAYRGAAPVQWAMLSGDVVTGVSVIHMTPRLDGGPVITTRETEIRAEETAGELEDRLAQIGIAATVEAVDRLAAWKGDHAEIGVLQDMGKVTQAPRLSKADGEIDWGRTAREIDCHVRGMQPWPIAFTHLPQGNGKSPIRLAIKQVEVLETPVDEFYPGEIVPCDSEGEQGFLVATADRVMRICRLQPAGKKEMAGIDFLRGHQPVPGTKLC